MCNVRTNADWSWEKCNSVRSIVTRLWAGIFENPGSIPGWVKRIFLFSEASRPPLGPAPPRAGALRLTAHLHLLPNLRICGDTKPLAHTPSQRAQIQIYLFLYFTAVERVNVNWIKLALYCIQCQCLPLSVSQIMFNAAHPSLKRGGRKSSVSLSYFFPRTPVMSVKL